jgi:hypothetical protein
MIRADVEFFIYLFICNFKRALVPFLNVYYLAF